MEETGGETPKGVVRPPRVQGTEPSVSDLGLPTPEPPGDRLGFRDLRAVSTAWGGGDTCWRQGRHSDDIPFHGVLHLF